MTYSKGGRNLESGPRHGIRRFLVIEIERAEKITFIQRKIHKIRTAVVHNVGVKKVAKPL